MPIHDVTTDGAKLAEKMRQHGNCYQSQDGDYFIEFGGGRVTRGAIDDALTAGLIIPRWDDKPDLQYWKVK